MGFRQGKQQRRDWNRWLSEHREALLLTGVPEEVFSDEQRWHSLLEEGGNDNSSGWNVEMVTVAEAARLDRFVREHYRHDNDRG